MAEETQAASSPAEEVDVFQGQQPTHDEYSRYRADGTVPERFKPAAPAEIADPTPADPPKEAETAPDSDPEDPQGLKPKTAKRIQQLLDREKAALARAEELERKLAEKEGVKTDPPPATAPQHANPKPTINDTNPDGTQKYAEYEDVVEAIGRWAAREERAQWEREYEQREAKKSWDASMGEIRKRFEDADVVIPPAIAAFKANLPPAVSEAVGTSPQFFDLCYELGSDPEKLEQFISLARTDQRAAIKQIFAAEDKVERPRDDKGKFTAEGEKAPEKKTSAPKPPSPVGGASSRAFDVSDESLSNEEWMRQRNKQLGKA